MEKRRRLDKQEVGRRVKQAMEDAGLTPTEVGAAIGYSAAAVNHWVAGRNEVPLGIIPELSRLTGKPAGYFVGEEIEPPPAGALESPLRDAVRLKRVPLIGRAPAGPPLFAEENFEGFVPAPANLECDFAARISGDSMEGAGFRHGDIVFCVTAARQRPQAGDMVVALCNGDVTVKWLLRDAAGRFFLRASNPRYADIPLNGQDCIQGVVVGSLRGKPRYPGLENELAAGKT